MPRTDAVNRCATTRDVLCIVRRNMTTCENFPILTILRKTDGRGPILRRKIGPRRSFMGLIKAGSVFRPLPVPRIEEPPPPVGPGSEVQVPVPVIPFQLGLPPSERNLGIGIEGTNVRPR